jgi:drug/metabolite transporter (DMT)-like permease
MAVAKPTISIAAAEARPNQALIVAAFTALYLIWGSTYLGIRFAIASIPPLLMAGNRFLISGLIMYALARLSGAAKPTPRTWLTSLIIGAGLITCGNGGVTVAEKFVPSALAALMIATVPIYMAILGWILGLQPRPAPLVWVGLIGGLAGVGLLMQPVITVSESVSSHSSAVGLLILLGTSLVWSICSLYSRAGTHSPSPFLAAGQQMICGSVLLIALAFLAGDQRFDFQQLTPSSAIAFAYLVLVGGLGGFPAYVFLLRHCDPGKVSTYAYVNPVVAVILGTTIGREPLTLHMIIASLLIVVSVALVITGQHLLKNAGRDGHLSNPAKGVSPVPVNGASPPYTEHREPPPVKART